MEYAKEAHYPLLTEDTSTDTVIIGAGIAGLTTAYLLKKAGHKVIVLEKDIVGAGVSGHTTGKITSQHNLTYAKLTDRLGKHTAQVYGEANQAALARVADIIATEKIDCDWSRDDNYVYTTEESEVQQLRDEAQAAQNIGLPASFGTDTPLPFPTRGAVKFSGQAKFHVRKYLLALAQIIDGDGSAIFENTKALGFRYGSPGIVRTSSAKVTAKNIVVATNVPTFPLMARGTYCALEYPMQSYIVAGRPAKQMGGMYISPDSNHYSILPIKSGNDDLLLIGGEGHIPGTRFSSNKCYQRLADYAERHFGITNIEYKWSHRDYLGYDDMPIIGTLYPWSKHTYTATGFMKWGLTNGTMASMILTDLITGRNNPWAATFSPHRAKLIASIPRVIGEHVGLK